MVRMAVSPSADPANPPVPESGTAADLSNVEILDAISEADSTIDAFISGRYVTPVAQVSDATPHPLDYWSRNIAAYNATLTFRGSLDFTDSDPVARRYTATMLALTAVRDNKANLPPTIPEIGGGDDGAAEGAGAPINQYPGDNMFAPEDFSLGLHRDHRGVGFGPPWGRW